LIAKLIPKGNLLTITVMTWEPIFRLSACDITSSVRV